MTRWMARADPSAVAQKYVPKKLNVKADPGTAGAAVLDLAGNGSTDAVVWSKLGVALLRQGVEGSQEHRA